MRPYNIPSRLRSLSNLACTDHQCHFPVKPAIPHYFFGKPGFADGTDMIDINSHLKSLVKGGHLNLARQMFEELPGRDEVTWTNMISGYVNARDLREALSLFVRMWDEPAVHMDPFVLSPVIKACGISSNIRFGECLHGLSVKVNLVRSVFVGSALLDMYMKVGRIGQGWKVFQEMPVRSVVTWTAAITGLVHSGLNEDALVFFSKMLRSGVQCDSYVLSIVLKACALLGSLDRGREIHCHSIKERVDGTSFVANTLADMYNKCGKLEYGMRLFEMMSMSDVVSWTLLINAYSQKGDPENAIRTFMRMRERGVSPNGFTFASVFACCASLGRVEWGEQLHGHATRLGLADETSVANSIVSVYSRCGKLDLAARAFHGLVRRNIISWSTIIAGYSQESICGEAFRYFSWMRREELRPNEYPLSSVLSACGNIAILEEGEELHALALRAGLHQNHLVQSSLINMYAKCGSIDKASKVFHEAEFNDIVSWTAMIKGYAEHGYCREAIYLFNKLSHVGLRPDSVAFIGILTACSHAGLVDLGLQHFNSMNEYEIHPSKEHYGSMIDLLCRAGRLKDAESMINNMPFQHDDVVWLILLRASRIHGDAECGLRAAEKILKLAPNCEWTLVSLANMYAAEGRWREVADIRMLMKTKGTRKEPGWAWIKVNDQISAFCSGDRSYPEVYEVHKVLDLLAMGPELSDHNSYKGDSWGVAIFCH